MAAKYPTICDASCDSLKINTQTVDRLGINTYALQCRSTPFTKGKSILKVSRSLCLMVSLAVISCGGHAPAAHAQTFTDQPQSAVTSPIPTPSDVILTAQPCFFDSNTVAGTCLLSFLNSGVGGNVGFSEISAFFALPHSLPSVTVTMNYLGGAFGSSDVFPAQVFVFQAPPNSSSFSQVAQFSPPSTNNVTLPGGPFPEGTRLAFIISGFVTNANGIECLSLCSWDITVPLGL